MMRLTLAAFGMLGFGTALAQDAEFLRSMRDDVVDLELDSNVARGEALQGMLARLGVEFTLETFEITPPPNFPQSVGTNIVVTLGDGSRDIVVGGHYDAIWLGNGRLSRGAVDNAASAVILTRLAAALAEGDLDHRVRIVFFDMEEIGLVGSRNYVATHSGDDVAFMVNLDVNGYGDTVFYGPVLNQEDGELPRAMESACRGAGIRCVAFPRVPMSDHLSFRRPIPTLSIAVLPAAEADEVYTLLNGSAEEQQALGRTPAILRLIHTAEDTSARIDPAGMALTLKATLALVRELDR